ncbi:MAG: carbon-nitrogen hydrolase family protein [Clostridiales Family XIII bacterium]|jgi:predicted amidohydrolase|nr:carbon-nitrogen hydrolase family protein [Clostridiales Family XIII bacterium]
MKFIVAACQPTIAQYDKEANLKKALSMIDEATSLGAKVIAFPEYFLTWPPDSNMTAADMEALAETIPGPSIDAIAEKCKETGAYCVAGSIIEKCDDGKLRNTCAIIGPDGGVIGKYSKAQPENAPAKFEPGNGIWPGNELPIFETPLGRWAVMIDMDYTNCEIPRIYGLKGADVIFAPTCWSAKFVESIAMMTVSAASQSLAYVISPNPVGWRKAVPVHAWAFAAEDKQAASLDLSYGGGTTIAFGATAIAKALTFSEDIAYAAIDPEAPAKARECDAGIYPFWRRPDLYGELLNPETTQPYGTHVKHDVPTAVGAR